MPELLLHATTQAALTVIIRRRPQALLITGPAGIGKASVAVTLVSQLLDISGDSLQLYPYFWRLPAEATTITIDQVRELQKFLMLKLPNSDQRRVVLLEDAHFMTTEAQNALLKTLEEPPADTILLLTAISPHMLLPTITSRLQQLSVITPNAADVKRYFTEQGHEATAVDKALLMSGGLPGLTKALITAQTDHPLFTATETARSLLSSTLFERLVMVEGLSKQKQLCLDSLRVIGRMARLSLERGLGTAAEAKWRRILQAAYTATGQLEHNTQPKLVMTNFLLHI